MTKERVFFVFRRVLRWFFSFTLGAFVALGLLVIVSYFFFERAFSGQIYPGVYINSQNFGGMTEEEATLRFLELDGDLEKAFINFSYVEATSGAGRNFKVRARDIGISVDAKTTALMAYEIGRSGKFLNDLGRKWEALFSGVYIEPFIVIDEGALTDLLGRVGGEIEVEPREAQFAFSGGRVTAFALSSDGRKIDRGEARSELTKALRMTLKDSSLVAIPKEIVIPLVVTTVKPRVTTRGANNLGIKELLGRGVSYFYDSIPERVFNINLATRRVSGFLVAPDEVFSFNQKIGTISAETGYKKAYAIISGKTVLDDGGGVCQVSTTLYRAVLNAGLPAVERVAHAYRVGFYEQGGFLPGIDATVYPPSPDFRFKNDTGNWILVQAVVDNSAKSLVIELYGTQDGRKTEVSKPVILSTSPPPEPIYQDDPNLAKGVVKQIDKAHYGAKVYFTRKVTRGGEVLINEKVESNYRPWAAVYARGTRE